MLLLIVLGAALLWFHAGPASLHAGGKKQPETVEIKFWHSVGHQNKDVLTSLIEEFNRGRPRLRVRSVFQGDEENLFRRVLSPENLPDLALLPVHLLPYLQQQGYLAALDGFIPSDLRADIDGKFWGSVTLDGSIYGVPFQYTTSLLYVNQHLLRISGSRGARESESWEQLMEIGEKIRLNTQRNWSIFVPMDSLTDFITYVESYTGSPLPAGGGTPGGDGTPGGQRLRVDGEGSIEAMRFLQRLVYEHRLMPPRITLNEAQQLFLSGNLGIMAASGSLLAFNQSNLPYTMNVWHLPRTERVRPLITGDCLVVMKDSGVDTNTVIQVIEHLMSFDSIIRWHTHTGTPAVRTSVQDSLDLLIFYEENPNYTTPIIELGEGRIFNPSYDYLEANIVMKEALARIMLHNDDPGPVLRDAQAKLDRLP